MSYTTKTLESIKDDTLDMRLAFMGASSDQALEALERVPENLKETIAVSIPEAQPFPDTAFCIDLILGGAISHGDLTNSLKETFGSENVEPSVDITIPVETKSETYQTYIRLPQI